MKPADLPAERSWLEQWLAGDATRTFHAMMELGTESFVAPASLFGKPLDQVAAGLVRMELRRVQLAQLFFATADMTELAITAGRSMPEFSLLPQDLPADYGLVVFGTPISVARRALPAGSGTSELPVVAATWGRYRERGARGLWVSYYTDWAGERDRMLLGAKRPREMSRMLSRWGRGCLAYDREQVFPFGTGALWPTQQEPDPGAYGLRSDDVRIGEELLRTLIATWLLMGQTITVEERIRPDVPRAERRRLQRGGVDERPVRVVTLRRARPRRAPACPEPATGGSGRVYRHRWIVHEHWRNQYYPSAGRHRPIWIEDHIAGPDGAPLLGAERVNLLKR